MHISCGPVSPDGRSQTISYVCFLFVGHIQLRFPKNCTGRSLKSYSRASDILIDKIRFCCPEFNFYKRTIFTTFKLFPVMFSHHPSFIRICYLYRIALMETSLYLTIKLTTVCATSASLHMSRSSQHPLQLLLPSIYHPIV